MGSYTTPLPTDITAEGQPGETTGGIVHHERIYKRFNDRSLNLADTDFGVLFDNNPASAATNNAGFTAAIAAARTAANGTEGAALYHPGGTAYISQAILLKNRVRLYHDGTRSSAAIKATTGFSSTTTLAQAGLFGAGGAAVNRMIELGHGTPNTSDFAFGARLENIEVDANNVAGLIPVFSQQANEQSNVQYCLIHNFAGFAGIYFAAGTSIIGVRDCEIYANAGATYGLVWEGWGQGHAMNCTINGQTYAAAIKWNTDFHVISCHAEGATAGIDAGPGFPTGTVTGFYGHSTVPTTVRVRAGGKVSLRGIHKNSGTTAVLDETSGGQTLTDEFIPDYLASDPGQGARQVVTGSRGGNAALLSVINAGVAQGRYRNDSTA